jgi:hypothetical protein
VTCVYVAKSADIGVKVGISGDAARRIRALRKEHRRPISLEFCRRGDASAIEAIEKQAHALLCAYRVKGEWFGVSVEDAVAAVLKAADQLGYSLEDWKGSQEIIDYPHRGRPATGIGRAEGLRLYPELSTAIEAWRSDQLEDMGRPEAIRRLLRSHPDLKRYLEGK